eukprot:2000417-Rhodomonas_salina.1
MGMDRQKAPIILQVALPVGVRTGYPGYPGTLYGYCQTRDQRAKTLPGYPDPVPGWGICKLAITGIVESIDVSCLGSNSRRPNDACCKLASKKRLRDYPGALVATSGVLVVVLHVPGYPGSPQQRGQDLGWYTCRTY